MKFINDFQKFMHGRYGLDDLTKYMFYFYIILSIINIFARTYILFIIKLILIIIIFYRTLSKKIYKRSNENVKFMKIIDKFKIKSKPKDTDTHIYKRCHHCSRILRLPIPEKKGIKKVKCPDCHKRNRFLILKSEKIEIIKKKKIWHE